jgi:hypothetical protein
MCRNEESLLSETVYHYQDSGKTFRVRELLDNMGPSILPSND